jgi:RNA polymerase sigma-70 factor, ECF subfamily
VTLTIEGLERHAVAVFDADLPLVNAVRNGDESAFEELVRRYDGKLYRVAQGIIHSHEDAEEVVQATFLKAYLNLYRFQGNSKFSTLADSHRHE